MTRLVLARPEARNALSIEVCDAIVAALGEIDRDGEARAVVLAGEGKVFCSGADFAAVSGPGALDFLPAFERMLEAVARFRLPVIARIHGAALGGGLQLATVCDFRIAEEEAKLGIPSSRLGIVINFENVQRLVLQAGLSVAKQVLMTGRTYTGVEAEVAGLITEAVPSESLDDAVNDLAHSIAALAPLSVQGAKREINAVADQMINKADPDTEQQMAALVAEAYASEDLQEGLAAMAEKRPPRFRG
ncbi:MAG: enoyl-CoA hydratase/isomerase family protein [Actinomycetota bacterium]